VTAPRLSPAERASATTERMHARAEVAQTAMLIVDFPSLTARSVRRDYEHSRFPWLLSGDDITRQDPHRLKLTAGKLWTMRATRVPISGRVATS
jgi:hypothetical protein